MGRKRSENLSQEFFTCSITYTFSQKSHFQAKCQHTGCPWSELKEIPTKQIITM